MAAPPFTFDGIKGFQRGISLLELYLNASKTQIYHGFEIFIARVCQPLL